jgi:glycosyltransferase involved in cell wall biosynthesis
LVLVVTHPMTARYLLRGQAAFLRRHGFEVWVVTSPGEDGAEFERQEAVSVVTVPMRRRIHPAADLLALLRLTGKLRRLRPQLVTASTPKAGALGMVAAWLARVPVRVYTLRGLPLETATGAKRVVLRWAERVAAGLAHSVVCVGPSLRRRYLELGLTAPAKATLIANGSSNGVDTERFRPTPERRERAAALRRALDIPANAPVIGCVGRFTRDKGMEDLLAAFLDTVLPAVPQARLLLVGEFEGADPVEPVTRRRLEGDPRVVRTGWVPDAAPYYGVMDLLALPSYREGFPNAPLEAAASGRPTVGFAAVGTLDAVEDGVAGALVPTGDRRALGSALKCYLEDAELRRRHGVAARERVEQLFRQQTVWEAWAAHYRRLLASHGNAT